MFWVVTSEIKNTETVTATDERVKLYKFDENQNITKIIHLKEGSSLIKNEWDIPAECGPEDEFMGKDASYQFT